MPHKRLPLLPLAFALALSACNKTSPETVETLSLLENAESFVQQNMTAYCEAGPSAIASAIPEASDYLLATIENASQSVGGFTRVDLVSARLNPIEFQDGPEVETPHPHRLRVTTVMEGTENNGTAIYLILGGTADSWEIIDVETDEVAGSSD